MSYSLDTRIRAFIREHNMTTARAWDDLHDLIASECAPLHAQIREAHAALEAERDDALTKVYEARSHKSFLRKENDALTRRAAELEAERDAANAMYAGAHDAWCNTCDERDALTRRVAELEGAIQHVLTECVTSHYMHWDREGKAGAACPACKLDYEGRTRLAAALAASQAPRKERT